MQFLVRPLFTGPQISTEIQLFNLEIAILPPRFTPLPYKEPEAMQQAISTATYSFRFDANVTAADIRMPTGL